MKIAICASLDFTNEVKEIAKKLSENGHEVIIPVTSEMILNNKVTLEQIKKEKESGEIYKRMINQDSIKRYCKIIEKAEAILVLNFDKKGIKNYIGGNVFLEMGFAHIIDKKIFLLNDVPEMFYKDEIMAMQPIVINGNFNKIR
jgi:polysaccharide deacetylase 2 family uncharacterized protein YibQ